MRHRPDMEFKPASALENIVAMMFSARRALSFARGSAGLYSLFSMIASERGVGEVIVPALCCETVALAAMYAGHTVRFADVSPDTLCVTSASLEPLMSEQTRAVVIVHLFGIDADCTGFNDLRSRHRDAVFVEDLAHALGGTRSDGTLLGQALDCTLLSFAESKIVAGDGGMLVFVSDKVDPDSVASHRVTESSRKSTIRLTSSLRNMVHGIADLWREEGGARRPPVFSGLIDGYRPLIVASGGIADENAVKLGLQCLADITGARRRNYLRYRNDIRSTHAVVPDFREGSSCWRCPVIFDCEARAATVTGQLRAVGIHASNHYFPLSVLFGTQVCAVAESVALRIVNLWTDQGIGMAMIDHAVRIINES